MNDDWRTKIDDTYSDDEARRIIERAAEIEKQGSVTETDLREIAGEASISQDALDRALAERALAKRVDKAQQIEVASEPTSWFGKNISPRTIFWVVVIGWLVAGVLTAIID